MCFISVVLMRKNVYISSLSLIMPFIKLFMENMFVFKINLFCSKYNKTCSLILFSKKTNILIHFLLFCFESVTKTVIRKR